MMSVDIFGIGTGWGIPIAGHTLILMLGGNAKKPGVVDGQIAIKEIVTILRG
jgi:hypothetical protein